MARWVLRMLYCSCIFSPSSNSGAGIRDHLRVQRVRHLVAALQRAIARLVAGIGLGQDRVEIEIVEIGGARGSPGSADRCGRSPRSAMRKPSEARISRTSSAMKLKRFTTFSGEPAKRSRSFGSWVQTPTGQVLEWHCRTMMQPMAISDGGADAEFLRAQHRGHHHVAAGLDAAVGAQPHAMAQAVEGQHLMHLGKPHLPGHAGIFDAGMGRGAGAARHGRRSGSRRPWPWRRRRRSCRCPSAPPASRRPWPRD